MWEVDEQRASIRGFAKEKGVDLVLSISAPDYSDVIFGSNQVIKTFGIYELSSILAKQAVDYALVQIVIFDGSSGKQIAYQTDHASTPRGDNRMLPDDMSVSAAEMARVRATILGLYEKLIDDELTKLAM